MTWHSSFIYSSSEHPTGGISFSFSFFCFLSVNPRCLVQAYHLSSFCVLFFVSVEMTTSLFSSITLCHFRFLFIGRVLCTLSFWMVFFYLVTMDCIFDMDLLCENSRKIQPIKCVCVLCVFFPSILDINGRTSRGHTGGRSHRIFNPPSFCGACLDFCREKDSAIPFPRRP